MIRHVSRGSVFVSKVLVVYVCDIVIYLFLCYGYFSLLLNKQIYNVHGNKRLGIALPKCLQRA